MAAPVRKSFRGGNDFTRKEQLANCVDAVRVLESQLNAARLEGDLVERDKRISEQQAIINAAQVRLDEINQRYASSPRRVADLQVQLKRARKKLAVFTNRKALGELARMQAQYEKLKAQLAAAQQQPE